MRPEDAYSDRGDVCYTYGRTACCLSLSRREVLLVIAIMMQVLVSVIISGWLDSHQPPYAYYEYSKLPSFHISAPKRLSMAPLQGIVGYEIRRWSPSMYKSPTKYMGTSQEADDNWDDLYRYGVARIPHSTAKMLAEEILPVPGQDGQYVLMFENLLRKRLHPEDYNSPDTDGKVAQEHADHCIDVLRQTLMCVVDINPMIWHWNERVNRRTVPKMDVLAECRKWEDVERWSREHLIKTENVPMASHNDHGGPD
ncbi:uncharacterized protein LAESUDRAFT_816704 [Laetiporus sulphureus 93-53]|uniref:Uncharacterized protein n=1 Tax=Laetiporus sulphureus 93-53 TaxID=1314785 RepID=A0A165B2F0_9APHY|nr:uncharacterized protein LAESUDRAFT_816704 [Laetiporus sulphureus 93-53]KZT00100.1 hypothetical protein LAESUDRAFT_816704 [Laetiporus sulphureus 93-53]